MNTHYFSGTPNILLVLPLENPSATIYIVKPLVTLEKYGYIEFTSRLESELTPEDFNSCDLVIFCRNQNPEYGWILEECLARKIATIYNLDDNLWDVPEELFYSNFHREPKHIQQLEIYLGKVDLILVYSQYLQNKVLALNSKVIVAKPCIDLNLTSPHPVQKQDGKIHITYLTGRGNTDPLLSVFSQALQEIINLFNDKIVIHWWGEIPEPFKSLPNSRLENINHDYNKFLYNLSHSGFDIGLAPLVYSEFYYSKTNTKFRDYGAAHIAGIYSNHPVYSDVIHGQTGLLVQNESQAWFTAIKRLIEDGELRERIKRQAYQFVKANYHQTKLEKQWLDVISGLFHTPTFTYNVQKSGDKQKEIRPINLSLGANRFITPGFQCLAKSAFPGVSIIADLEQPIPLQTNSVGKVEMVSSFGRRVEFNQLLAEIYRVCQHMAQVSILAPYTESDLTINQGSNHPIFNESTPAEWSDKNNPDASPAKSENSSTIRIPDIDIRCIHYELFNEPSENDQDRTGEQTFEMTTSPKREKIYYQCVVIKGELETSKDIQVHKNLFFEPTSVQFYRIKNLNENLIKQIRHIKKEIKNIKDLERLLNQIQDELNTTQQQNNELISIHNQLLKDVNLGRIIANDLDTFRNRKIFRVIDRIYNHADLSQELPVSMQKIIDDSFLFLSSLKGFKLKASQNLNLVPHLSYNLYLPHRKITGLYLAAILDISSVVGALKIEICTHKNQILAQSEIQTKNIERDQPSLFSFSPFTPTPSYRYTLRVLARDVDIPVRIYEWHKDNLLYLNRQQTEPFIGYKFEES